MRIHEYRCDDCIHNQGHTCEYGYDLEYGDCPDLYESYESLPRGKYGWTEREAEEYGDMMDHQYRDEGRYLDT